MSSQNLNPFSYAVLVLIGERRRRPARPRPHGPPGPDLQPWAESQYYAETKRLEELGYLTSRREPGVTRPRTHYELTDKAREALAEWAPQPTPLPKIHNEGIVRVLGADLVGEAPVVESLRALREEIADARARLDVGQAVAETLPHREKYLALNHRLAHATARSLLGLGGRGRGGARRPLGPVGAGRVELPFADVLQRVRASRLEAEARARDEVLHGPRDENLVRARLPADPRADREGDARDLALVDLALPGVDPGS